jgi:hypothetical protein
MLWSFGTVATLTTLIAASLIGISVYIFLVSSVLPNLLLKQRYDASKDGDRGIRRYTFEGGRAIVYEPSAPYRKYLKQYILSANGNEKYIKCKFAERVTAVRYEVIAFDKDDRLIDTVRIAEYIFEEKENISNAAMLPMQTAYVKVVLRSVNGVILDNEKFFYIPASRKWGFVCAVTLGLVTVMVLVRALLVMLGDLLFNYSSIATGFGDLFAVAGAVVFGLILSFVLERFYRPSELKKKKRKRKN